MHVYYTNMNLLAMKSNDYSYNTDDPECSDVDNGGCSDTCIDTPGSYYCTCHPGYYLTGNGKTCKGN